MPSYDDDASINALRESSAFELLVQRYVDARRAEEARVDAVKRWARKLSDAANLTYDEAMSAVELEAARHWIQERGEES